MDLDRAVGDAIIEGLIDELHDLAAAAHPSDPASIDAWRRAFELYGPIVTQEFDRQAGVADA